MARKAKSCEVRQPADRRKQEAEILIQADALGLRDNYLFSTAFERLTRQHEILNKLWEVIEAEGPLVTKEYVKGRPNLTANPAISEFNKTSTAANNTVSTILNLFRHAGADKTGARTLSSIMEALDNEG